MNNNTKVIIGWIIVIILILVGGWYLFLSQPAAPSSTATSTTPGTTTGQTVSDGTIAFSTPSDFGLAVTPEQVLVTSYIPPCDQGFGYCLYYSGSDYQGTNFESAGLRIQKRPDLMAEGICLDTPPGGFASSVQPDQTASADTYSASVFSNVGDAGAGHIAQGALYRLFVRASSACYEFETRVGMTQFANYPAGSIKEFTDVDRKAVVSKLNAVLKGVTVTGNAVAFPGL
jgi:hypothetical protein